jgi:16S rRNA (adenine1518-N6/adenine1519-N6)-dimethyltransferase
LQIPKKSLGQNFLIDKNIRIKIVNLISVKNENIIEIGPGNGQITDEIIIRKPKKLILIEKDNNLNKYLIQKYNHLSFISFYEHDALFFDFNKTKKFNIISNLPYNLSVKIIIKLLTNYNNFKEMIFMIQKDVAEKMNYNNKNKMNKFSFFINTVSDFKIIFDISNKVFYPNPKVKSSIIKINPLTLKINKIKLWEFSKLIFNNKRKKIKNVIKFKKINIITKKLIENRAEDLTTKKLMYLFKKF